MRNDSLTAMRLRKQALEEAQEEQQLREAIADLKKRLRDLEKEVSLLKSKGAVYGGMRD